MLKKVITYTDFDDNERVETVYFHMSTADFQDWLLGFPEIVRSRFLKVASEPSEDEKQHLLDGVDPSDMILRVRDLILSSYGQKSEDGRRFVKSAELSKEFSQTIAYDQIYNEMLDNPDNFTAFVEGVMPKSMTDNSGERIVASNAKAKLNRGRTVEIK